VNAGDTGFLVHFFKDQGAEFTSRSRYSLWFACKRSGMVRLGKSFILAPDSLPYGRDSEGFFLGRVRVHQYAMRSPLSALFSLRVHSALQKRIRVIQLSLFVLLHI
jgi:hypothetical protein